MIRFIYGKSFSARTDAIMNMIKEDTALSRRVFLIVPEQFAVGAERLALNALPPSAQLTLEIVSFSRLYNRVCREYGGLHYNYVSKPVKHALMWKNLRELSPLLETYSAVAQKDASFCDMALAAVGEFKSSCISAEELEAASSKLKKDSPLARKLRDLALIYASYSGLVSETFTDSADDISRLSDVLDKHPFFEGACVYIDGFTSFTSAERRVIERIFASAESVAISIPLPDREYESVFSASIEESCDKLLRSANKFCSVESVIAPNTQKTRPSITYFSENLFTASKDTTVPEDSGGVYPIVCTSPYTEAEAAARIALTLLRSGYRLRDIVVIARDAESYRGIIEPAFERCALPYYFSEKSDLSGTPIVKFILSALRIKLYGWQTADVISHIKTGLYNLDTRDCDLFESYISSWQVRGDTFTSGDFTMNPDGYTESIGDRAKSILTAANSVRAYLCEKLIPFFEALDNSCDVTKKCRAVYEFICNTGVSERLTCLAENEMQRGNAREANEYSRLFSLTCDALGELASAMQNELDTTEVDDAAFAELLTLFYSKCEIGTIPTSADQITVGSAKELRTTSHKVAILIGLCEGVFPATVSDRGILSFSEKSTLEELGIEFSERSDNAAADELMYLYRAASAPTDALFLLTHKSSANGSKSTPSLPFLRAKKLFQNNVCEYDSHDLITLTPTLRGALPYLPATEGTPTGDALLTLAKNDATVGESLALSDIPVSDTECKISDDVARKIFGDRMRMSQSRLDKFVKCHFNYYCESVLKLRTEKVNRFEANNVGTFVHFILEKMLCVIVDKDGITTNIPRHELEVSVREIVDEYIKLITPEGKKVSARLKHLYKKLYTLSLVLISNIIEEFRHSAFRPEFFELNTDGKGENPSAREFLLTDGSRVVFSGIIDRVDVYRNPEGKVYIRVVDYKTGSKSFSLEDIQYGLNIQMLLYLFTLTKNANPRFRARLGGEAHPAGVVYLSSNIPVIELEDNEGTDEVIKAVQGEFTRSGLLSNEREVLEAMNDELSPDFLCKAKPDKNGEMTGKSLASPDFFEELEHKIETVIVNITTEMRSGNAAAAPLVYKKADPCEYCDMKPICRYISEKKDEENERSD